MAQQHNSASVARAAEAVSLGGCGTKWSQREDNILRQMREDNRTNKEIGARLGRTSDAVGLRWALLKRKAEDAEIARAMATGESGRRRCLCGCGQMFLSRHRGERIAPECRELWQSAAKGVGDAMPIVMAGKRRPGAK
jgi:hypothetical protein